MKKIGIALWLIALWAISSCIDNPLSYPRDVAQITAFEVEGQKSVSIDPENFIVNVVLKETADIDSVVVSRYEFTESATPSIELPQLIDMRDTIRISYTTYPDQTYEWKIVATQPIERYVQCDNMIGDAVFDLDKKSIIAYFPEDQLLSDIRFTKMKLEAKGSKVEWTYGHTNVNGESVATDQEMSFPINLDCILTRKFKVRYRHEVTEWTFTAVHKVVNLEITGVSAWCYSADIFAAFKGSGSPYIEFKEPSDSEWTQLKSVIDGTNVTASVDQLTEGTSYLARVVNGTEISEEFTFTTDEPTQLYNMSFDEWSQSNPGGYTWYPRAEDGEKVWDSANPGVNMMSAVNSTRPEYVFMASKGGAAARLESVKVFGMFGAGNVFTGSFVKATISGGVGAELDWGIPFASRPYSLKGYYSYAPKVIDNASGIHADKMGTMDKAQIQVILTDWDEPFRVATASGTFVDIEKDPHIIAHGVIETDVDTQGKYQEFECVLEYRDVLRTPKYIVVSACSSLYGDYFTGGLGSVMYVDDFEFVYK
ncbi:MAG: PCMD domain-containing protein [Bacteroidales bacterium]|nr:PCMD domain-containing protein [Bacteroidales bacterium]